MGPETGGFDVPLDWARWNAHIIDIGGITGPINNQTQMIEQIAQFSTENPTLVRPAVFADLFDTAIFPDRMQQFNVTAINHANQGRFSQETVDVAPMAVEQPEQAGSIRQVGRYL